MSKAFTKEDDGQDEIDPADDIDQDAAVGLGAGSKNYMTRPGFERLRAELQDFLNVQRPKLVETVAWAASNGDRSENADYIYGKRKLREIDRRIRFLTKRLDAAEVVDPENQKSETVLFGATITVKDEDGAEKTYKIVGIDETDAKVGKISWISPIGKALLGKRVGDVAVVNIPKGEVELEIVRLRYAKIE